MKVTSPYKPENDLILAENKNLLFDLSECFLYQNDVLFLVLGINDFLLIFNWMLENGDQINSKYGRFSRSECLTNEASCYN